MILYNNRMTIFSILEKLVNHVKNCDDCHELFIVSNPSRLEEEISCHCGGTWKIPYHLKRDYGYSEFISAVRWLSNSDGVASIKSGKIVLNPLWSSSPSSPSDVIVKQSEKELEYIAQNSIEYLEL